MAAKGLTLRLSELFRSIQGEGASAGAPAVFLRLGHCNLRCTWCDTPYTWDFQRYPYAEEIRELSLSEVLEALSPLLADAEEVRLVVTGGEPLIQQASLSALLGRLDEALIVEVETNGTLMPRRELLHRVTQWNVSPKLPSSGESRERAWKLDVLRALQTTERAWLKLVLGGERDLAAADELLTLTGWDRERLLFMAEGRTAEELAARRDWIEGVARARGARVSPRLHIERWGSARGV